MCRLSDWCVASPWFQMPRQDPGAAPLLGKWEKCVHGPEHQTRAGRSFPTSSLSWSGQPSHHQDVTGTAFPGGVCAGEAHAVAKGQTCLVVNLLLDFMDRVY